ncbi:MULTISPECIES: helix-turn-helix domain-containing protein [Herbaspirillum]|uniref:helix-turn-helix domain-containing protein n=1 Tax=Herbaspirillum TaxID=963 RepID=UPI000949D44C|nr:helix-turn-helix transcriptional regulator [Herbaspirillum camelliae]
MQTTDPRWSDESSIPGSGNVFIDLGFEPAEAEVMLMRVKVLAQTSQRLKEKGWTQAKAAEELGITQPRVSRLMKGKVEDFSLDMLVTLAGKLGLKPQISFAG